MDVAKFEQEITAWIAGKLNLTVDTQIFRGGIPDAVGYGVGVRISEQGGFELLEQPQFTVQFLGKFDGRDNAMSFLEQMRGIFPTWGRETDSFELVSAIPVYVSNAPFEANDKGVRKVCVSFPVTFSVLTKAASVDLPATSTVTTGG